jgi:hypothetical protein
MSIIKPALVAVIAVCFAFTGNAFARDAKTSSSKSKNSASSASAKKKKSSGSGAKSSRAKQKSARPKVAAKPRATWIDASSLHFDGFAEEFPEEDLPEPAGDSE